MHLQCRIQRIGRDLIWFAKGVPGALHYQPRATDLLQMLNTGTFGLARRVKRIAKADKAGGPHLRRQLTGHACAHRLAAQKQTPGNPSGLLAHTLLQHRHRVGRTLAAIVAARRHIGELKAQHLDPLGRQRRRQLRHKRAVHRRAGAMGQQQRCSGLAGWLVGQH